VPESPPTKEACAKVMRSLEATFQILVFSQASFTQFKFPLAFFAQL
jgi:hypothetical protein